MNEDQIIELFAQSSKAVLSRHRVKNAITPIVYICGLTVPACFATAYMLSADPLVKYPLIVVGLLAPIVALGSYLYLLFSMPDKLQSEDFQIRQEVLHMVSKQGGKIKVLPMSLPAIANPSPEQLEHNDNEEGRK